MRPRGPGNEDERELDFVDGCTDFQIYDVF